MCYGSIDGARREAAGCANLYHDNDTLCRLPSLRSAPVARAALEKTLARRSSRGHSGWHPPGPHACSVPAERKVALTVLPSKSRPLSASKALTAEAICSYLRYALPASGSPSFGHEKCSSLPCSSHAERMSSTHSAYSAASANTAADKIPPREISCVGIGLSPFEAAGGGTDGGVGTRPARPGGRPGGGCGTIPPPSPPAPPMPPIMPPMPAAAPIMPAGGGTYPAGRAIFISRPQSSIPLKRLSAVVQSSSEANSMKANFPFGSTRASRTGGSWLAACSGRVDRGTVKSSLSITGVTAPTARLPM
mmetsp:Transcript_37785/g.112966  ORF Transcript_37785/g.112966 Transcript_37785/m.112966 type:complete len:306 (+) Transcript_37785:943-1860(+)